MLNPKGPGTPRLDPDICTDIHMQHTYLHDTCYAMWDRYVHAHININKYIHIYVCMYKSIHIRVGVCIYIYIYIYICILGNSENTQEHDGCLCDEKPPGGAWNIQYLDPART